MARLREFDIDEALDAMMGVFWRQGYEGASMQDIEAATGLNKQSLYRVFKDKRSMYLAALDRYEHIEVAKAAQILTSAKPVKERFRTLFDKPVALAAKGVRSGCFLCNAATDQGQQDEETTQKVSAALRRMEKSFRAALSSAPGYAGKEKSCDAKAASLLAAYLGIRVLVRANAPLRVIKAAATEAVASI